MLDWIRTPAMRAHEVTDRHKPIPYVGPIYTLRGRELARDCPVYRSCA